MSLTSISIDIYVNMCSLHNKIWVHGNVEQNLFSYNFLFCVWHIIGQDVLLKITYNVQVVKQILSKRMQWNIYFTRKVTLVSLSSGNWYINFWSAQHKYYYYHFVCVYMLFVNKLLIIIICLFYRLNLSLISRFCSLRFVYKLNYMRIDF